MNTKRILLATLATLILCLNGCGTISTAPLQIAATIASMESAEKVQCPAKPVPTAVKMQPVKWEAITDQAGKRWMALDRKQYENLVENLANIRLSIKQKNSVIRYLETCIDNHNTAAERYVMALKEQLQRDKTLKPGYVGGFSPTQISRSNLRDSLRPADPLLERVGKWKAKNKALMERNDQWRVKGGTAARSGLPHQPGPPPS